MRRIPTLPLRWIAVAACVLSAPRTSLAGPLTDWFWGPFRQPPAYPVGPTYGVPGPPAMPTYAQPTTGYATNYGSYATNYGSYAPNYGAYPPAYATTPSYTSGYAPQMASPVPLTTQPLPTQPLGGIAPSIANQPITMTGPNPMTGFPQMQPALLPNAGYVTQYNKAAVTYYRPVTQFDPATGSNVTRMMPCTSYELQAQRPPVLTQRPALFGYYPQQRWPSLAAPVVGNSPNYYSAPTYNTTPVPSNTMATTVQMLPLAGNNAVQPGQYYSGWPTPPAAASAIPSGSMFSFPNTLAPANPTYPVTANYQSYPTTAMPMNAMYNATPNYPVMPSTTNVLPYGTTTTPYPATSPYPGTVPSTAPTYPSTIPSAPLSSNVPSEYPGGWRRVENGNLEGTDPNGGVAPNGSVMPSGTAPGNISDPESQVRPSFGNQSALPADTNLQSPQAAQTNASETSRFGLKSVDSPAPMVAMQRQRALETPTVPSEPTFDNVPKPEAGLNGQPPALGSSLAAPNALMAVPSSGDGSATESAKPASPIFDAIRPIEAPPTAPAPKWNQGLMDQRDRTAGRVDPTPSVTPARTNKNQPIRWISTEVDPRDQAAAGSKTSVSGSNGSMIQQPSLRPSTANPKSNASR